MKALLNAFSLQMLDTFPANVKFYETDRLPDGLTSFIGHQDLADLLGVPMNRVPFKFGEADEVYIAQYVGGRLPEGTTNVPQLGLKNVKFFRVIVERMEFSVPNDGRYSYE